MSSKRITALMIVFVLFFDQFSGLLNVVRVEAATLIQLVPYQLTKQTNLTGSVTDIQDDPSSPDANWLIASSMVNTEVNVNFQHSLKLTEGANLQEVRALVRKVGGTNTSDVRLEVRERIDATTANLINSTTMTLSSATPQLMSLTFDASSLAKKDGSGVEVWVIGIAGSKGKASVLSTVEVGAISLVAQEENIRVPEISNLAKTNTDSSVSFTWTNPSDFQFDHVKIYRNGVYIGSSTSGDYTENIQYMVSYDYRFTTVDANGIESVGVSSFVRAEVPIAINWGKSYGGSRTDYVRNVKEVPGGGFVVAGSSTSGDGDVNTNKGGFDALILRTDSAGEIVWANTYGGSADDEFFDVALTADGGFVATGLSQSSDGDVVGAKGLRDIIVVKFNSDGELVWKQHYGGGGHEFSQTIFSEADGGFVIFGFTTSTSGDVYSQNGSSDILMMKLDSTGNITWFKTFGGTGWESMDRAKKTSDGGYLMSGNTDSASGDLVNAGPARGAEDALFLKVDSGGNLIWIKRIGGTGADYGHDIAETDNGEYVAIGDSMSPESGDMPLGSLGLGDTFIAKLDVQGELVKIIQLRGEGDDIPRGIQKTAENEFLVVGATSSTSGDFPDPRGDNDGFILKIDANLNLFWIDKYGGAGSDTIYGINPAANNGFIIGGYSSSTDGDYPAVHGGQDIILLRVGPEAPKPVTNLTVTSKTASQVSLSWNSIETGLIYDIYRDGVLIASDIPSNSFADNSVTSPYFYEYTVIAKNEIGPSDPVDIKVAFGLSKQSITLTPDGSIGPALEDFEDGSIRWEYQMGSLPWGLNNQLTRSGSNSLGAANPGQDNTTATFTLPNITGPTTVSFWYMVSSEANYDKFFFKVNGASVLEKSGELPWAYFEYSLPEGTHSLSWEYQKDGSVAAGYDTALIDDVIIEEMIVNPVIVPINAGEYYGVMSSYDVSGVPLRLSADGGATWGTSVKGLDVFDQLTAKTLYNNLSLEHTAETTSTIDYYYLASGAQPVTDVTNLMETHTYDSVTLSWDNPNSSLFSHANIYRDGVYIGESIEGAFTDEGLSGSSTYTYKITAVDTSDIETTGKTISVTTSAQPAGPTREIGLLYGLAPQYNNYNGAMLTDGDFTTFTEIDAGSMIWDIASSTIEKVFISYEGETPNGDIYIELYSNGTWWGDVVEQELVNDGYFILSTPRQSVTQVALNYSTSAMSPEWVKFKEFDVYDSIDRGTTDNVPPGEVSNLSETHTDSSVTLSWDNPIDADFAKAKIYRDNIYLGESTNSTFTDSSVDLSQDVTYKVTTADSTGNESTGKTIVVSPTQMGNLSIGTISVSDFGAVTLDGSAQIITASMAPFEVSDQTGTGDGWRLTVQATAFREVGGLGLALPEQSLSLNAPTVSLVGTTTSTAPVVQTGAPWDIDKASSTPILSADIGAGMGAYNVDFGNLSLVIPAGAKLVDPVNYPSQPTPYESTITFSVISGP